VCSEKIMQQREKNVTISAEVQRKRVKESVFGGMDFGS